MDLGADELQFLCISDILKESISIPKQSPKTFSLVTLTLIFPLSFAILAHSLFTHPILSELQTDPTAPASDWTKLLHFPILLPLFSSSSPSSPRRCRLHVPPSTKPVSSHHRHSYRFQAPLHHIFMGFSLHASLQHCLIGVSYSSHYCHDMQNILLLLFSVMERSAWFLVFCYCCLWGINIFGGIVVHGGNDYRVLTRIMVGGFLVGLLVIVNLVGLLVQSVFYYVCKSYHHQGIDKSALYDHLGGYLGEYVPLKSSIQMENLDA
ncbi:hypothetical protein Sango_2511100 [Sesamum angolense]|uniref:Uncharacterized protein n=1 Tax=Sesamum angolense TaxID=2727404 RepID=A0AAE2BIA9_9LAMI|nr:hypothetical protein Sango_2511100 [Sesamum angolense]